MLAVKRAFQDQENRLIHTLFFLIKQSRAFALCSSAASMLLWLILTHFKNVNSGVFRQTAGLIIQHWGCILLYACGSGVTKRSSTFIKR